MSEQPKDEIKIKDLLKKLQILTNGLEEEKKKAQGYLDRIREYDESLHKKEAEIVDLRKEKFELKSKLTIVKSQQEASAKKNDSVFSSFLSKVITEKPVDETKLKKLGEKINLQKSELKNLTQQLMDEKETFDQQKIKFQTQIAIQNQQMSGLKQELEKAKSEIKKPVDTIKVAKRNENIEMLKQNFNKERDEFSKLLAEVKNELKVTNDENDECTNKLLKIKEECERANSENTKLKDQISEYGSQIGKLKKEINDKKLSDRMFQVERIKEGLVKNKKVMTINFSWNKSRNIIEVKFKRMKHGGKVKEDVINILDITKFEKNEKKPENIDVIFNVSKYIYNNLQFFIQDNNEQTKYIINANELIIDYLFQSYKEFLNKANELLSGKMK